VKLRTQILLFLFLFALTPLLVSVGINLPLVLDRTELFYHKAYLQNLRADFRDLDQHLASRDEMVRLLAKLPEPGLVLGHGTSPATESDAATIPDESIDLARARYTAWINQILYDQMDIIQISFLGDDGQERFWLMRDRETQQWQPTSEIPDRPPVEFVEATLRSDRPAVLVSPISINQKLGAEDPRWLMTLRLACPIGDRNHPPWLGAVVMYLDIGGMARRYSNTLWVHQSGQFLEQALGSTPSGNAFALYPGLKEIFSQNKPGLWKGNGEQLMWVPLLRTEDSDPLWVGRRVDPFPLADYRNALILRVSLIILFLVAVIWLASRWFADRADQVGHELKDGIQAVLEREEPATFSWSGPQELTALGESLTRLTERHVRNTRNLQEHARQLEESNRYKSEFLANVSHELRTPLNSVLLLSKLLASQDSGMNADHRRQVQVIHEASKDLQSLIDNILDLSRIEAQRINFNLEAVDLPALLNEMAELVRPQFEAKHLPLLVEIDDAAAWKIFSDPDKLGQIIKNFLSNAVKFTEQGEVVLRLSAVSTTQDCPCPVRISVTDTGIGIPRSQHGRIFEAFRQADGSTSRRYGGTGLGLAISNQLAHLLGGEIELDSHEGMGSTFALHLPLEFNRSRVDEEQISSMEEALPLDETIGESPAPPEAHFTGQQILLVDADVQSLLRLTPLLERWGLQVSAAADRSEAEETLADGDWPDLVLVDLMLPNHEGYDTIRFLRNNSKNAQPPIIALTQGDAGSREAKAAGVNALLHKPVDAVELKELLSQHLRPI